MAADEGPLKSKTGWREIGWFVLLWAMGVVTITIVGFVIRLFIGS